MNRRIIPDEDIVMESFYIEEISHELMGNRCLDGVFCECGNHTVFKNRAPTEPVTVICRRCGRHIDYGY